jgi:hypothetical protein
MEVFGLDSFDSAWEFVVGSYKHGNETSGIS